MVPVRELPLSVIKSPRNMISCNDFYLHVQPFVSDGRNQVTAVLGETAILPCELTPSKRDDSAYLVLWYKDIFGTPIYRFVVFTLIMMQMWLYANFMLVLFLNNRINFA